MAPVRLYHEYSNPKYHTKKKRVIPIKVTPIKKDNEEPKSILVLQCIKYQIFTGLVLAINRLYLFQCNKILIFLSYIYSVIFAVVVLAVMVSTDTLSASHLVFKYSLCCEYIGIVLLAFFTNQKKMMNLFRDLNKFDELLNISKDLNVIDSGKTCVFWAVGCILYTFIEYAMLYFYLTIFIDGTIYIFYVMMLAHDCEQIMFFVLLRNIYMRLRVVKGHVAKLLSEESGSYSCRNYKGELNKVEELSKNVRLDISSLHRVYDLLYKSASQLNSTMSLPMIIILLSSGLSTTMLLKMMVKMIQTVSLQNSFGQSIIIYLFSRSMKYSGLVVVPCYYASITFSEVSIIRTELHNAIHSLPMDKLERRKAKAFYQLTRENEFSYALGGVIKLNMSLPLSYISLCTTYLVISIQFSKFFD